MALESHRSLIDLALENADLVQIRRLSILGYIDSPTRQRVWSFLLGIDEEGGEEDGERYRGESHPNMDTVAKDVARSLCNYDICQEWTQSRLECERGKLSWMINTIMCRHSGYLHYIQGYHDVCAVFLIVCDYQEKMAIKLCEKVSQLHLREILRPNLDVVIEVLNMLFPLLSSADPQLAKFLARANAQSFFALSWVLTWFSHTLEKFDDVARIFDFLLASHPCMPLYIAAAFVQDHRDGLFQVECDMPMIHHYFQTHTTVLADYRPHISIILSS
uniref:Rab-GAP TBC domain-containing protein n=1 Tax=Spongospora subterranea TaxID=70186 RepID=A0A0H5RF21_9EUKA|eukprot:CRZ07229.1 hypothetical protein [Spongospora subterranea]